MHLVFLKTYLDEDFCIIFFIGGLVLTINQALFPCFPALTSPPLSLLVLWLALESSLTLLLF